MASFQQKVVITGGLGFIGSHVADAYLGRGWHVILIDSEEASVIDGIEYETHPRCTVVRARVEDYLRQGGTFRGVDRVIHAASPVGPARLLPLAGRLGSDMVGAARAVVEACIRDDTPLCVFSSAEVYNRSGRLAEGDDLRVPARYNARVEYAIAKALIEAMTANCRCQHGLRAIVVRPFNVAGPRQSRDGGFVIPTFVQQALADEPLTVFATGRQVRAFLSASDLSRFLVDHMDAALGADANVYNLGNPANAVTVEELAHLVRDLCGSASDIVRVDGRAVHGPLYAEAESVEKVPVLGSASELGWRPRVGLRELILETVAYYRARRTLCHARAAH